MAGECGARISKDHYFMNIAIEVSRRSTCTRRQIGAIIVSDVGEIKSTGYNGNPRGLPHCEEMGCIRDKMEIHPNNIGTKGKNQNDNLKCKM